LRKIVNGLAERVEGEAPIGAELIPVTVSRRAIAAWAVACAAVIVPLGAALGPAWDSIRTMILGD
jgi:hypothetical protein